MAPPKVVNDDASQEVVGPKEATMKMKNWLEAKSYSYDGSGWGDANGDDWGYPYYIDYPYYIEPTKSENVG